jgi:dihydrofolate reductase
VGKVITGFSMSLDGFIAGPEDDVQRLFAWYSSGDTDYHMPSGRMVVKVSPASAEVIQDLNQTTGAIVSGRRLFDVAGAWAGRHPLDVPVFVVTHTVPQEWVKEGSPFTFVTDGVASAVEKAKVVAGDKNVGVGGANIARQCLEAGLLDEIQIDLVPVLLGKGIRLFDHLGTEPIDLERIRVVEAPGVTHLRFRVAAGAPGP